MISIYKNGTDSPINKFYGQTSVKRSEVIVKESKIFGKKYRYAVPSEKGVWAFGGNILFTSNGIYPEFNEPIRLHDRDMKKEA